MRRIAAPWSRTFKGISVDIEHDVIHEVSKLLSEFEDSATPLLEECTREEVKRVRHELPGLLKVIAARVKEVLDKEQKGANRCLAPYIQEVLRSGYDAAVPLSGKGSSALRKVRRIRYVLDALGV